MQRNGVINFGHRSYIFAALAWPSLKKKNTFRLCPPFPPLFPPPQKASPLARPAVLLPPADTYDLLKAASTPARTFSFACSA